MKDNQTNQENELTPVDPQQLIKDLQEQLATKDTQLAATQKQLHDIQADSEGWLITTQNPIYDSSMWGIEFRNGAAFIAKGQEVPFFKLTPEPEDRIVSRNQNVLRDPLANKEEVRERIQGIIDKQREREAMSTAEHAVEEFKNLKGYRVEYYGPDDYQKLRDRLAARAVERNKAEAVLRAKTSLLDAFPPGYEGEVRR